MTSGPLVTLLEIQRRYLEERAIIVDIIREMPSFLDDPERHHEALLTIMGHLEVMEELFATGPELTEGDHHE